MVRVGIVGIGFGQQVHVPAFRADPRARVDAICASTLPRARDVATRLTIPRAYGDWRELVADPELDAVALSVPATLQPAIAVAAARAGKHVFLEKPLALDVAGAEAIVAAVRESQVAALVDFEFRALPAWRRARELLTAGAIGALRHVYVAWHIETMANRLDRATWKRVAADGGGTLSLFVSHTLDTVRWLGAPIERVAARLSPSEREETRVDAWLELAGGARATISAAADAPGGTGHRIELYGDAGALVLENRGADHFAGFTLEHATHEGRSVVPLEASPTASDGRIPPVAALVARFLDSIERGVAADPSLADGLAVQRAMSAIRDAHRSGAWQS